MKKNIISTFSIIGIVCFSNLVEADLNNGLIAHYAFEENTNDSSGNGNHGIEHGKIKYVTGIVGKAGSFNGINDYLASKTLLSSELQGKFSINVWVNVSNEWLDSRDLYRSSAKYMSVVGYGTDLVGNWTNKVDFGVVIEDRLEAGIKNHIAFVTTGNSENGVIVGKNNSTLVGKWVQITALYENGKSKLYVNGIFIGEKQLSDSLGNKHSLIIGGSSETQKWNRNYKGLMDEVSIYNRALTESEIQELYNEGSITNTEESVDTPISLENKSFGGNETPDEMRQRYKNNIIFYNSHPEYHHPEEIVTDLISLECIGINTFGVGIETIYSAINLDLVKYLSNLDPIFYGIQCYNKIFKIMGKSKAHLMLSHFLIGSGSNVEVDMMSLFLENRILTNNFIISIRNNIEKGVMNGKYKINQSDWAGGGYSDWNLALGTIMLEWEANGDDLILYLNDKYSFDINPNSSEIKSTFRWTSPLYIEAANLILQGKASDFFMVGKLKVPLEDIY